MTHSLVRYVLLMLFSQTKAVRPGELSSTPKFSWDSTELELKRNVPGRKKSI